MKETVNKKASNRKQGKIETTLRFLATFGEVGQRDRPQEKQLQALDMLTIPCLHSEIDKQ